MQWTVMHERTVFNTRSSFDKALSGICLLKLMVYFEVVSSPIVPNAVQTKARAALHGQMFSMSASCVPHAALLLQSH